MIIYNSMIAWVVVLGIIYKVILHKRTVMGYGEFSKVPLWLALLTFFYIIFWVGIRSGVADTAAYISMFNSYPADLSQIFLYWNDDSKAPGFATFSILFKCFISKDYHVWLMAIAILSGLPIMWTIWKKSNSFFYSSFLFIVSLNFFWMLNGMRQFWAAAIMFALTDWIEEQKTLPYIIAALFASTIHMTVVVMIPLYFVAKGKPFDRKMIYFIIGLLMAIAFLDPFISGMEVMLEGTPYSGYSEQFSFDDGVHPIRVLVMLVAPTIAFLGRNIIIEKENILLNISINMSTICAGIYMLGVFTSGIFVGRLPIYFELYNLFLIPYLLKECFTKQSSRLMFGICTIGFIGFYYLQMKNSYYISDLTGLVR